MARESKTPPVSYAGTFGFGRGLASQETLAEYSCRLCNGAPINAGKCRELTTKSGNSFFKGGRQIEGRCQGCKSPFRVCYLCYSNVGLRGLEQFGESCFVVDPATGLCQLHSRDLSAKRGKEETLAQRARRESGEDESSVLSSSDLDPSPSLEEELGGEEGSNNDREVFDDSEFEEVEEDNGATQLAAAESATQGGEELAEEMSQESEPLDPDLVPTIIHRRTGKGEQGKQNTSPVSEGNPSVGDKNPSLSLPVDKNCSSVVAPKEERRGQMVNSNNAPEETQRSGKEILNFLRELKDSMATGMSEEQALAQLKLAPSFWRNYCGLLRLTEELKDMVRKGDLSIGCAKVTAQLSVDRQLAFAKEAIANRWSEEEARGKFGDLPTDLPRQKGEPGRKVSSYAPDPDPLPLVEAIKRNMANGATEEAAVKAVRWTLSQYRHFGFLTKCCSELQGMVSKGKIAVSTAQWLAKLPKDKQYVVVLQVVKERWSAKKARKEVEALLSVKGSVKSGKQKERGRSTKKGDGPNLALVPLARMLPTISGREITTNNALQMTAKLIQATQLAVDFCGEVSLGQLLKTLGQLEPEQIQDIQVALDPEQLDRTIQSLSGLQQLGRIFAAFRR